MCSRVRGLPIAQWPVRHRELHQRALGKKRYVDPGSGLANHWRRATSRTVWSVWGLWLTFCRSRGLPLGDTLPADTITRETLAAVIADLQTGPSSVTPATFIRNLNEAIRVMQPDACRQELKVALRELSAAAVPQVDLISATVGSSDIYLGGKAQYSRYQLSSLEHWRDALAFGDEVLLAVWSCANVRARTMALTQRRHLCLIGDIYELRYAPHETKTRRSFVGPLPLELTPVLVLWMNVADTVLGVYSETGKDEDKPLWPTRFGRQMSQRQQYQRVCAATSEEINKRINPQRLRRILATGINLVAPTKMDVAAAVLRHTPQVSRKHYVKVGVLPHARQYVAAENKMRSEMHPVDPDLLRARVAAVLPKSRIRS